jgi:DNA-directed RNA polymerase sigma subunit (sigma70/sigma32)
MNEETPLSVLLNKEKAEFLWAAFESLNPRERFVVDTHLNHQVSYQKIGQTLLSRNLIPLSAERVRQIYVVGLNKIRKKFQKTYVKPPCLD